jgi:hypothetical protein
MIDEGLSLNSSLQTAAFKGFSKIMVKYLAVWHSTLRNKEQVAWS